MDENFIINVLSGFGLLSYRYINNALLIIIVVLILSSVLQIFLQVQCRNEYCTKRVKKRHILLESSPFRKCSKFHYVSQ